MKHISEYVPKEGLMLVCDERMLRKSAPNPVARMGCVYHNNGQALFPSMVDRPDLTYGIDSQRYGKQAAICRAVWILGCYTVGIILGKRIDI